jgi:ATP-dependent RNA helicase DeaD
MARDTVSPTKGRKRATAPETDNGQDTSIVEAWNAGDDFAAEPVAEAAKGPSATTEEAAPKRTRKKKTDEPVAEAAAAGDAVATDDATVEKPKRSHKKAADAVAEEPAETTPVMEAVDAPMAPPEPVAEAPKPKRARAKKADAEPKSLLEIAGEKPSTEAADAIMEPLATAPDETREPVAAQAPPAEPGPPSFIDLGLSDALLKSITAVGYEEPTPIQMATIPLMLEGRDVIAQAQTGSGKTAAFGLPIIETINPKLRHVQALILCPTRELAIQVSESLHKYGRHKEVETLPIYGGQPYERQFRGLQRGPQIVVGTPGRVMDHMRRQTLDVSRIKFFILDEGDEMLDMGFIEDIEWILEQVPEERQTALFSATMPPRIVDLSQRYLNQPERISVVSKTMTVPETTQAFYEVPRNRKIDALTRILDAEVPTLSMIFCRTKMMVDELGEALLARGYSAETLHGDLSQAQRDRVMRRFRTGQADILIATDVAARGLDIPDVSHVINYDIPGDPEAYVHRIGRTGRAGKTGVAITLVTAREVRWIRQIERAVRARIEPRRLPTVADVAERRVEQLKTQVQDALSDEAAPALAYYVSAVEEMAEEFDLTTLAAAALRLFAEETGRGQIVEAVDDVAAVTVPSGPPRDRGDRFDRGADRGERRGPRSFEPADGKARLFMNVGHNLGIRPQDIVGAIANEAGIPGRSIGSIDIFDTYSFVEVPSEDTQRIIEALGQSGIKGKYVNVEVARPDAGPGPRRDRFDRGPDRGGDRGGYRGDRGGDRGGERRFDRPERPEPGNWRGGRDSDRGPRPPFDHDRAPARREFEDRAPRFDRDDRAPRFEREERAPRPPFERDGGDRGGRYDRPDRFPRTDRGDRGRPPGRPDRPDRDRF